jgi:hypothetical protein
MSTMSINATTARTGALQGRRSVPWLTVVPLAVVMAYADGFWLVSLRGAVGAIERTQGPFAAWLRESTMALPLFVIAVLGAITLAARWFGPVLRTRSTFVAAALMVVAAGTLVGIAALAASSAYDYHLQSTQLQLTDSMRSMPSMPSMPSMGSTAHQQQASLGLQLRAVGYGSAILLLTNLVLVGWALAFRGGRLDLSTTGQQAARPRPQPGPGEQRNSQSTLRRGVAGSLQHRTPALPTAATRRADGTHRSRADGLRVLLAAGLIGSAAIHAAVIPEHLREWGAAGLFFIALTGAELAVAAVLLLARPDPRVLLAAAVASIGPLALWLYSRTLGLPFGPEAGVPEQVGLTDLAACALEILTLLLAVVLLRGRTWLRRPPASAHLSALSLLAVIAVTTIGLAGSGLPWLDAFGNSGDQSAVSSHSH